VENAENEFQKSARYSILKKIRYAGLWISIFLLAVYLVFTFLYHGPDSNYSRKGFIKHVGFPPPPTVSKIYYWYEDLWLDPTYRLRFVCSDPKVVEQFITNQQLQECKKQIVDVGGADQEWWAEKNTKSNLKCFSREIPQNFWNLWYDPITGTVWYEEYST
jgi:hypothetical protein